jgi:uncharacterized protein (TIGR02594 family)
MPSPYQIATSMLGSHEHVNHSALTTYLKNGGVNLDPEKQAWCAAFVNASLQQAGVQGSGSNMARSLLNVGTATDKPNVGDIAVFSRGGANSGLGHVGFFQGYTPDGKIRVLAGNQGDSVSEGAVSPDRLLGFRSIPGTTLNSSPTMDAGTPGTSTTQTASSPAQALSSGLDTIAQGINPQQDPKVAAEAANITPVSAPVPQIAGGDPNSAAAQQLMAALLTRKRPMGTTLTSGLG